MKTKREHEHLFTCSPKVRCSVFALLNEHFLDQVEFQILPVHQNAVDWQWHRQQCSLTDCMHTAYPNKSMAWYVNDYFISSVNYMKCKLLNEAYVCGQMLSDVSVWKK